MNLDFLYGILNLSFWGYVLVTFLMVQFTFMGVTLYLHRDATHRSLDLHPVLRHIFRFWLWMSSGIVTKEWVAVHRKHHAKCETKDDPHSPVIFGLKKVLLEGAELYQAQARNPETTEKFGRGTPDDWMEHNVYLKYRNFGIALMVVVDLVLFGVPGIIILAVQMLANPLMAAGVINGIGHYYGYRNFECPDAARNVMPWGFLVAGEELHNNHHAFPSSAKFSIHRWEFDIGWLYIRIFQTFGLAKVLRVAPEPAHVAPRNHIDLETVRAVIVNRMHVLREYSRNVTIPVFREQLITAGGQLSRRVKKLLVREPVLLDQAAQSKLKEVLANNQALQTVHEFRERLRVLWNGSNMSNESLLQHLKEWIAQAEASRIKVLQDFAASLRGYAMQPA
ncbi:stearoyl-CoA desaturase (delta-9 desaturase) [Povalibacter uvarum]|uniref:Stearoyl-CoA desaturase (Delta-9 desaturase) n=1 Tax=Povalibacter uvarum TaxID=732238 RepID=A0A841HHU4_9GAMM|nr:fatty acid desaturase [Povalibacter uvarum]MBB6092557.1 stearoyl-CoA desaturase (delta-9 desaturase) [Povalibacter uvarum]